MHAFLSNLANRQTDRQTDRQIRAKTFTSFFVGSNNVTVKKTGYKVSFLSRFCAVALITGSAERSLVRVSQSAAMPLCDKRSLFDYGRCIKRCMIYNKLPVPRLWVSPHTMVNSNGNVHKKYYIILSLSKSVLVTVRYRINDAIESCQKLPKLTGWRDGLVVGRRTCDLVVAGSRPGRDAAA